MAFDHADPDFNKNIRQYWQNFHPMGFTENYGGTWMPLTYEYIKEILLDTDHFSNRGVMVSNDLPPDMPGGGAPPITADPPYHFEARQRVQPPFSFKEVEKLEDRLREICQSWSGTDGSDYGLYVALQSMSGMLGFDPDFFSSAVPDIFENINLEPEKSLEKIMVYMDYVGQQIDNHVPGDNLLTFLINAGSYSREQLQGMIMLLTIGSIDTTWYTIGNSLHYLATHPDDLQKLQDNPELIDSAVEELLRMHSGVSTARLVKEDYNFHGYEMKKNQWILIPLNAANRDPDHFENPEEFIIDRKNNKHIAFGLGIHRCLGAHLGKLELKVAIQEFIKKHPKFSLDGEVEWSVGQVRGPKKLPLRFE
jgi:cytochrome P450